MDFIIETQNTTLNAGNVMLFITFVLFAILCIILTILYAIKRETFGIVAGTFAIVFIVLSSALGTVTFNSDKETIISHDTDKFKAWVLDEYLIEINDEQATALLDNTANEKEPYINSAVYVKTFNGEDAIATLFHDDNKWRLVVTQSIAVPSN
jgi:hypothetical protein